MTFYERFQELTGNTPYPWQSALYHSLITGNVPHRMVPPPGAGKTSFIPVWLCALWHQLENNQPLPAPRPLYFPVDRSIVFNQPQITAQNPQPHPPHPPTAL